MRTTDTHIGVTLQVVKISLIIIITTVINYYQLILGCFANKILQVHKL